jgi:ABC-type polysaccharide/polyol phosphate transport system ATPase subunit
MIRARNVSKFNFDQHTGHELVLRDAYFDLPTDRPVAILGKDPRVVTSIMLLLSGVTKPDRGEVDIGRLRMSPLIQAGGVPGASLIPRFTAAENIGHLAAMYGVDAAHLTALVESVCNFGAQLNLPVSKFDWPMRRLLELTVVSALPFDCYFVDRLQAYSGPALWRLFHAARLRGAGLIFSTNRRGQATRFFTRLGNAAAVVSGGHVRLVENPERESVGP